jgi:hypothetical protein
MFADVCWNVLGFMPVPVAARSKASICGAGIAGSDPDGGMDACVLCVLCVAR